MSADWLPIGTSDADPDAEWISMWSVLGIDRRTRWQWFRQRWHEFWLHRYLWHEFIISCSHCPHPKPEPYGPFGYTQPAIGGSVEITVDDDETHSHTEVWKLEKKA